ncbi:MAG: alpha-L-fucosidase [Tannerella sp.]|jgi:alpha-L-fucosidase|nr:alpha-L-fucosidase [Tannerella sp.]
MDLKNISRRRFLQAGTTLAASSLIVPQRMFGSVQNNNLPTAGSEDNVFQQFKCPQWFKDAKYGLWLHWGPQTIPARGGGWYARHLYMHPSKAKESWGTAAWEYHRLTFGHQADFGYKELCNLWKAEKFDAENTVQLFKKWGARYVAIMANHHDNYDLFNSSIHGWNATKVGPKRDILGEFAEAARRNQLPWVASTHAHRLDFFDFAYDTDPDGPRKNDLYDGNLTKADGKGKWWEGLDPQQLYSARYPNFKAEYRQRLMELVENYRPDMLYFDNSSIPECAIDPCAKLYENSKKRNGSIQTIVTVKSPQQGTVLDFEKGIADGIADEYWQTDTSMNEDWFYKQDVDVNNLHHDARSLKELFIDIISKRGALLLNVAVYADGSIPADQYAILEEFGEWLNANSEAIYGTTPWKTFGKGGESKGGHFNERRVTSEPWDYNVHRFTQSKDGRTLYIHIFGNPAGKELVIDALANKALFRGKVKNVSLIGSNAKVKWSIKPQGLNVRIPEKLAFTDCNILKVTT